MLHANYRKVTFCRYRLFCKSSKSSASEAVALRGTTIYSFRFGCRQTAAVTELTTLTVTKCNLTFSPTYSYSKMAWSGR